MYVMVFFDLLNFFPLTILIQPNQTQVSRHAKNITCQLKMNFIKGLHLFHIASLLIYIWYPQLSFTVRYCPFEDNYRIRPLCFKFHMGTINLIQPLRS